MPDSPLSATEWQAALVRQLDPSGIYGLAGEVGDLWREWRGKGAISVGLQALYVRRSLLDYILGGQWQSHDVAAGDESEKFSQDWDHLLALRGQMDGRILAAEAAIVGGRGGAIAELANTTPVMVTPGTLDPNSRGYRGDPLVRTGGGWWRR